MIDMLVHNEAMRLATSQASQTQDCQARDDLVNALRYINRKFDITSAICEQIILKRIPDPINAQETMQLAKAHIYFERQSALKSVTHNYLRDHKHLN